MQDSDDTRNIRRTNDYENRFKFHPPKDEETKKLHGSVRNSLKTIAHYLGGILPEGREKALAITKLEEAMFWTNASIARQESGDEPNG